MSLPPPRAFASRISRLDLADLLLVLILSLGGIRLLGLFAGAFLGRTTGLPDQPPEPSAGLIVGLFTLQSLILVGALYLVAIQGRSLAWSDLGLVRPRGPWLRQSVTAALLALPLVYMINAAIAIQLGDAPANPQIETIAPAAGSTSSAFAMLLVLGIAAPFAEELIFRGLLYAWLREKLGIGWAVALSALCFSLAHGIVWLAPALAVLGVLLAWLYEKHGTLWAPIVTHGVFNAISTLLLFGALRSAVALQ